MITACKQKNLIFYNMIKLFRTNESFSSFITSGHHEVCKVQREETRNVRSKWYFDFCVVFFLVTTHLLTNLNIQALPIVLFFVHWLYSWWYIFRKYVKIKKIRENRFERTHSLLKLMNTCILTQCWFCKYVV